MDESAESNKQLDSPVQPEIDKASPATNGGGSGRTTCRKMMGGDLRPPTTTGAEGNGGSAAIGRKTTQQSRELPIFTELWTITAGDGSSDDGNGHVQTVDNRSDCRSVPAATSGVTGQRRYGGRKMLARWLKKLQQISGQTSATFSGGFPVATASRRWSVRKLARWATRSWWWNGE